MLVKPHVCAHALVEFYDNFQFDGNVGKSSMRDFEREFDAGELGFLLNIPSLGFDNYLKKKRLEIDNDVDTWIVITREFF